VPVNHPDVSVSKSFDQHPTVALKLSAGMASKTSSLEKNMLSDASVFSS
jgi:hypothetical protein